MTDSNGINEEYEKIFGVTQRPTLFSNDDIEYNALRQEIINSPTLKISKKNLPFEGIKLVPYEDYCAENTVKSLGGKLAKLFRIKQVENGIVVCNAAGFYNKQVGFVVIQGSYCRQSDFFSQLATNMSDTKDKISFLDSFKIKNGMLQQCIHRNYSSASLAASIFLGRRASFKEWKDIWGRSLDYYYSEYKDSAIEEKE